MDPIFNMSKVRFTKLDELITKHVPEIGPTSRVNLFINLEPILRKLTAANIEQYLQVKTEEKSFEMISNIINLASHYRLFFTKNKIYSKIYFYIGYPFNAIYRNRTINPDYRKTYQHKFTKDMSSIILSNTLSSVIPFIKIILEYVEGVYFIESDSVEPSLVPHVITKDNPSNNINFILSTDKYDYQYVNKGFYIIRPKLEHSYIVSKDNLMDVVKAEEKIVSEIEIGNNFYPFILSLLGDKYRNIEKIKRVGFAAITKMIDKAISTNVIGKDVTSINILANIVKQEHKPLLLSNFFCTDIDTQFSMLNIRDLQNITSQLKDKFDNVALKNINDEYFRQYPLYLIELTQANNLLKKKETKNIFGV